MADYKSDSTYMQRALALHHKSHDPHRQVGALIVGRHGDVLSEGANAPLDAFRLSRSESLAAIEADPNWKYFVLEHAERNAIYTAFVDGKDLRGATMYGTLFPCADCARAIVAAGISRFVVPEPPGDSDRNEKWLAHYHFAHQIFELGDVKVDFLSAGQHVPAASG